MQRTQRLKGDLVAQGRRVQAVLEAAFDAIFNSSIERAGWVKTQDDVIDAVDVELERACVQLLADATKRDHQDAAELTAEEQMLIRLRSSGAEWDAIARETGKDAAAVRQQFSRLQKRIAAMIAMRSGD